MALSLGARCIKSLLFIFNLLFVVTGIILIAVGSVIKTPYSAYHNILDHGFFTVPVLLIAIGVIILFVSFFGCCGAFKENYCMTITFGVSLILIFILEISGGIAGYVLKDKISEALEYNLLQSMKDYNTSSDIRHMWDLAQSNFHCCGTSDMKDWNGTLPNSCCKVLEMDQCTPKEAFPVSCYESLKSFFISNAGTLGGAGIGIAVIQILGILFAYSLATSIGKEYESLEKV